MGPVGQTITWTITAIFWGAVGIYAGSNYGYMSVIRFVAWIIGFFMAIGVVVFTLGLAARAVSSLRDRLMVTERGRRVEYVVRRGLLAVYVVLITPVILLVSIAFAISMLGQIVDTWIVTPLQLIAVIVDEIKALARWIGIG